MPRDNTVVMEDVRIVFKNFAGREGKYNREGDRSFSVLLDMKTAKEMEEDGWNVKYMKPRDDEDDEAEPRPHLPVAVSYKGRPPRIVMVTSRGRTTLDENTCEMLDYADIRTVDLIVRPYEWVVNGKTGIKAYLQSIFVTIEEDALELKYADLDDARSPRRD